MQKSEFLWIRPNIGLSNCKLSISDPTLTKRLTLSLTVPWESALHICAYSLPYFAANCSATCKTTIMTLLMIATQTCPWDYLLTSSLIGSINDCIFLLTNQQVVLMGKVSQEKNSMGKKNILYSETGVLIHTELPTSKKSIILDTYHFEFSCISLHTWSYPYYTWDSFSDSFVHMFHRF